MAGGLGKRLTPLTEVCPKPMLKIGNKPLLATILDGISAQGFKNVFISVNYKSDIIKNFIQDGTSWDLNISYIHEDKPLGTAGSISNISPELKDNTIVINYDFFTPSPKQSKAFSQSNPGGYRNTMVENGAAQCVQRV